MIRKPIVAVDGPAAAGKGTLARRLAKELGLPYLDTGLLYRAVGRLVLDAGDDPSDPVPAERAALALEPGDLNRDDLRGPAADAASSAVAAIPTVRTTLLAFQRNFGLAHGAVMDGRDIGTVIFPEAPAKLFVTASLAVRARRRWLELQQRGVAADLATIEREMQERDARDAARSAAPLRAAPDAILLDTSDMDADTVFEAALAKVKSRL